MKIYRALLLLVCLSLCSFAAVAHDFTLKDMQGKTQRLVDYRGKWVLVNFWATWCEPCQEETPDLIKLYKTHKDTDLIVIGVALDSTKEAITAFTAKYAIPYPIVYSSYTTAETEVGKVNALPTTYLYDPKGQIVIFQEGGITVEDVETFLALKNKHTEQNETK